MKLSKSDQEIDHDEHEKARERAANASRSTHFEVGTHVCFWYTWFGKRQLFRAEVIARPGNGGMLVKHSDGMTQILYPQALAYESKV